MAQSSVSHLRQALERLEATEAGQGSRASPDDLAQQLAKIKVEIDRYLQADPNDAAALVIAARVDRLQHVLKPIAIAPGQTPSDSNTAPSSLHGKLDRALALEPSNAEAHYWKARLYGTRNPVVQAGRIYYVPVDLNLAIQFSRKAVTLAPDSGPYRRALALYLVEAQNPREAIEVIRPVDNGRDPIHILLRDLERLPVPNNATLSRVDSESFAQQQMARGRIKDYPQLRVRFYVIPTPVSKIEELYSGQWSQVKFFSAGDSRKVGDGEIRFFQQYLSEKPDKHVPAASQSQIPSLPDSGIMLTAIEMRNLPSKMREQTPAGFDLSATVGDVFCYFIVVNFRRVP